YNPVNPESIRYLSMSFNDFFRVLPNHILLDHTPNFNTLFDQIKSGYIGFSFLFGGLIGLYFFKGRTKYLLYFLAMIGFLFSMGPYMINDDKIVSKSILWPIVEYLNLSNIFRLP